MARPKGYVVALEETYRDRRRSIVARRNSPQGEVLRSRIVLACEAHPDWTDRQVAGRVGCAWQTVKKWRRRWHETHSVGEGSRPGRPRSFPPETRAQATALACSLAETVGRPFRRWDCVEIVERLVRDTVIDSIHRTTVWRWLKAERLKPWRHHLWQHPTAPDFLQRAKPVLELYAHARALLAQGVWVVCSDEKTSMQALERVHPLRPAAPGQPMHVAAHSIRRGISHLFGALSVADGRV